MNTEKVGNGESTKALLTRRSVLGAGAILGASVAFSPRGHAFAADEEADGSETPVISFYDVNEGDWFYDYVNYVEYLGVMTGYRDESGKQTGYFGPYDPMTREDVACMLFKRYEPEEAQSNLDPARYSTVANATPFEDVPNGAYYTPAVNWCYASGIFTGYEEKQDGSSDRFGVGGTITRAEMITVIYRAYGDSRLAGPIGWFPDAGEVQDWAGQAVGWAVRNSIIEGDNGYLRPNDAVTRAEAATMMTRYLSSVGAQVVTNISIALGATATAFEIDSLVPFAQDVSADNILLYDDFETWKITQFERVSDKAVTIQLEGDTGITERGGTLTLDEGCFGNPYLMATVSVWGKNPEPIIERSDEVEGCGYVDGAFKIPVNIDSAQLREVFSPADASVPADSSVTVAGVELVSPDLVVLTLDVPGETATDQFETLDAALTAGGIVIAKTGTNAADDLVARAKAVLRMEAISSENGFSGETTALEYVRATPFVSLQATGAALNADGSAIVTAKVTVDIDEGDGSADLQHTSAIDVVSGFGDGNSIVDAGSVSSTDASAFTFTRTVDADTVRAVVSAAGLVGGDDQVTQKMLDQALDSFAALFSGSRLSISDGVFNSWGIPQHVTGALVHVCSDGASLLSESNVEAGLEAAQEALKATGEIVKGIAALGGDDKAEGVASLFCGVASIFGFAAKIVSIEDKEAYSIDEVMHEVQTIHSELTSISAQVTDVGSKLTKIEDRTAYYASGDTFTNTCVAIVGSDSYGLPSLVHDALNSQNLKPYLSMEGETTYDSLSDDAKNELRKVADATAKYTQPYGGSHTLFTTLAGYLVDQHSRTNICELYFNYVDTYYNWEPETFPQKKSFFTYVTSAFINVYAADMAETTVAYYDAKANNDSATADLKTNQLKGIASTAANVVKTLIGETSGKKVTSPSAVYKRMYDYSSTQIVNLVASKSCNLFTANNIFTAAIWDFGSNGDVQKALDKHDVDYMPIYPYSDASTLSLGNLRTMADNLTELNAMGLLPYSTLLDEMKAIGTKKSGDSYDYGTVAFDVDSVMNGRTQPTREYYGGSKQKRLYRIPVTNVDVSPVYDDDTGSPQKFPDVTSKLQNASVYYSVIASGVSMKKISEKSGGHHERSYNATTFNLSNNVESADTRVYWARTGRTTRWHIDVDMYNYLAFTNGTQASISERGQQLANIEY